MSRSPTFRRLPRAVREQQMLDAAVRVFSRLGYDAASMDEIAEDAGISKPMVYAYLGTKEELFIACIHREATGLMEAIASVVFEDPPPDEQFWRGFRAFFNYVGAHRDGWAVLFRRARAREPFASELAKMRHRIIEVIAGLLRQALAARGRTVRDAELEATAYALVGAAESLADWLTDHPDEDADRTATRMMNIVWVGAGQLLEGEVWRPAPVT